MRLTRQEEDMASGKYGPGIEKAIKILIRYGEIFNADCLVPLASAHTMPKEPIELLKELTEGVENTAIFTSLHPVMSGFDPNKWEKMGIDKEFGVEEQKLHEERVGIYKRLGINQTYTCLPMHAGNLPRMGQRVSWIGTGNQTLVNSIIGARTNRDGTVINLCAAITGRAPNLGLYLDENRKAEFLVQVAGVNPYELSPVDIAAVGYYAGFKSGNYSVVIDGLPKESTFDEVKGLVSLSTSGATCMCHVVGVTPEAPDLMTATGGKKPKETLIVGRAEIEEAKDIFRKAPTDKIDLVMIGCPHCSIDDARKMAAMLDGKKLNGNTRLWVGMGVQTYALAKVMGYADIIEKAGGVLANACLSTIPDSPIPKDVKVVATNSFKIAHYVTGLQKGRVQVSLGTFADCVNAAVTGKMEVKG